MGKAMQVIVCILAMCLIAVYLGKQAAENQNQTMRIQNLEYRNNSGSESNPCYPGENTEVCFRRVADTRK